MRANWTRLALAVTLVSGVGAFTALAAPYIGPRRYEPQRLHVYGHISGLYPGVHKRMRVSVRNPLNHMVTTRLVRAKVRSASRRCPRLNVAVGRSRLRLRVPAHSTRRFWLRVTMRAAAPNACRGGGFNLRFWALAGR